MIEISQLPGLLRRHLFWLVATTVVFMALAFVYLMFKAPVYRATAELLIEPEGLQIVALQPGGSGPAPALQALDIDSQAYVILSAAVLNDVANKLDLDNDPEFTKPGLLSRLLGKSSGSPSQSEKRAGIITALREILQVTRLSGSYVFQIRASYSDAVMAAAIANEVSNSYISQSRLARSNALARAGSSFGKQAAELRARVEKAEAAVETYKAKNGLISTGTSGLVVDQQIQALNSQIAQSRVDLEKAKAAYQAAEPLTAADVEAGGLPTTAQNSVLNTLRLQHARLAQQEAEAATTLGANHPTLKELRSQLANTQRQIHSELQRVKRTLKSAYEQAKDTLAAVEQQSTALQSENSSQGKALIELRQLQSEAEASRAVYEAFLQRSKELEEQPKIDADGSRILSEAQVPTAPSGPRKILVLLAAGIFGFAAAAASVVGLAMVRGQITSDRDLVARTGLPILSHIPLGLSGPSHRLGKFVPVFARRAANDTAGRNLALTRIAYALRQAYTDARPATILVLSAGEGRDTETLARQIAAQLHDMGEDVLFAHSTAPIKANSTKMSSESKKAKEPESRIELLSRMAAAAGAPNTADAATAERADSGLSRYLTVEQIDSQRQYAPHTSLASGADDFLIVDCGAANASPILPVLLKHCDGILLVSEIGATNFGDLDRTLSYLEPWRDRVIGNVVLAAA